MVVGPAAVGLGRQDPGLRSHGGGGRAGRPLWRSFCGRVRHRGVVPAATVHGRHVRDACQRSRPAGPAEGGAGDPGRADLRLLHPAALRRAQRRTGIAYRLALDAHGRTTVSGRAGRQTRRQPCGQCEALGGRAGRLARLPRPASRRRDPRRPHRDRLGRPSAAAVVAEPRGAGLVVDDRRGRPALHAGTARAAGNRGLLRCRQRRGTLDPRRRDALRGIGFRRRTAGHAHLRRRPALYAGWQGAAELPRRGHRPEPLATRHRRRRRGRRRRGRRAAVGLGRLAAGDPRHGRGLCRRQR